MLKQIFLALALGSNLWGAEISNVRPPQTTAPTTAYVQRAGDTMTGSLAISSSVLLLQGAGAKIITPKVQASTVTADILVTANIFSQGPATGPLRLTASDYGFGFLGAAPANVSLTIANSTTYHMGSFSHGPVMLYGGSYGLGVNNEITGGQSCPIGFTNNTYTVVVAVPCTAGNVGLPDSGGGWSVVPTFPVCTPTMGSIHICSLK